MTLMWRESEANEVNFTVAEQRVSKQPTHTLKHTVITGKVKPIQFQKGRGRRTRAPSH